MYYVKGSKHLYLIDFNPSRGLPVWSNAKEEAVCSQKLPEIVAIQEFLTTHCQAECYIGWEE